MMEEEKKLKMIILVMVIVYILSLIAVIVLFEDEEPEPPTPPVFVLCYDVAVVDDDDNYYHWPDSRQADFLLEIDYQDNILKNEVSNESTVYFTAYFKVYRQAYHEDDADCVIYGRPFVIEVDDPKHWYTDMNSWAVHYVTKGITINREGKSGRTPFYDRFNDTSLMTYWITIQLNPKAFLNVEHYIGDWTFVKVKIAGEKFTINFLVDKTIW